LQRRWQKRQVRTELSDADLQHRAQELNEQYFGGTLVWHSIIWVTNQESRWGSCTPATGIIRISHRLASVPGWVRDYVIMHELAHLLESNHGSAFWKHVNRYARAERARGYLMALGGDQQDADM
jgi:predicted metal-dependent hydrolase